MEPLSNNVKLRVLHLRNCKPLAVTLEHLAPLTDLEYLSLDNREYSGVANFKELHPGCHVSPHDD